MGDRTRIERADATWNPIRARHKATSKTGHHCEPVSEGCRNCYADRMNQWRGTGLPYKPGHRDDIELYLDETVLEQPLRWKRPRRIFPCSMTDLYGPFVPDEWIDRVFAIMALARQHTFLPLTKRACRMRAHAKDLFERLATNDIIVPHPAGTTTFDKLVDFSVFKAVRSNVWLGTSCEDQATADVRIPDLVATPAAVHWVSAEPMLGRIDFTKWLHIGLCTNCGYVGSIDRRGFHAGCSYLAARISGLDRIVIGGESGPRARPMHPDWARDIRDQCEVTSTPFFLKQWGEWKPIGAMTEDETDALYRSNRIAREVEDQGSLDELYGRTCTVPTMSLGFHGATGFDAYQQVDGRGGHMFFKVGKLSAGRSLDGVEHNGMPEAGRPGDRE